MEYVLAALAFGLSAGVSPGPFAALVAAEALAGGWRRGAVAALAPFITDGAIISLSVLALTRLPPAAVTAAEAAGGLLLFYLGYLTLRSAGAGAEVAAAATSPRTGAGALAPLWRGVAVNFFNPNPWVFWLTAGGPVLRRAAAAGPGPAAAFLGIFFTLLVGSKVLLAAAVAAGRHRLGGRGYRIVLGSLGVALLGLGARALWRAAGALGGR